MHILIGLCMGLALLYYWLLGHWFARILMCIVLVGVAGLFGFFVLAVTVDRSGPLFGIFAFLAAATGAWPGASVPTWYWQKRLGIA